MVFFFFTYGGSLDIRFCSGALFAVVTTYYFDSSERGRSFLLLGSR
jgi:hypothetical protein